MVAVGAGVLINGAFAGGVFKRGVLVAGRGAPTAMSQRCPGCPCAGFTLPVPISGAEGLLTGWMEGLFDGFAGVDRVGCEADLVVSILPPPPSFSPQEIRKKTQMTDAANT